MGLYATCGDWTKCYPGDLGAEGLAVDEAFLGEECRRPLPLARFACSYFSFRAACSSSAWAALVANKTSDMDDNGGGRRVQESEWMPNVMAVRTSWPGGWQCRNSDTGSCACGRPGTVACRGRTGRVRRRMQMEADGGDQGMTGLRCDIGRAQTMANVWVP
jgi:hypothetical protein